MKRLCLVLLSFLLNLSIFADIPVSVALLRDSMYNNPLNHDDLILVYDATVEDVQAELTGYDLYVALSRCEYYMGRSYAYAENKNVAGSYYDKGLEYAQKALDIKEGYDALLMYGENLSQNCAVKPTSYAIANGLKINGYAKDVLKLEPKNGAAMFLRSAQHAYAPTPFHNYRKAIKEMNEILDTPAIILESDDMFNVTSAIAYAHMKKKEYTEALVWIEKALEVYSTNYFALLLKEQIMENR